MDAIELVAEEGITAWRREFRRTRASLTENSERGTSDMCVSTRASRTIVESKFGATSISLGAKRARLADNAFAERIRMRD